MSTTPHGDSTGAARNRFGRDETARNPNIDPDPQQTWDPDVGAEGLQPGQTPPESNSATASPPAPAPSKPPKAKVIITIAVIVAALLVGMFFVGYISGIIG